MGHTHPGLRVTLDDRVWEPAPYEEIFIPHGARHRIAGTGSQPSRWLEIFLESLTRTTSCASKTNMDGNSGRPDMFDDARMTMLPSLSKKARGGIADRRLA